MKKKPDPCAMKVQPVKSAQPTLEHTQISDEDAWWRDDPKREEALKLLLAGAGNKSAVARALGTHRNTIDNWCQNIYFASRMATLAREHISSKRQQRLMATNRVNDINERVTIAMGNRIVKLLKIDETGTAVATEKELSNGEFDKNLRRLREIGYEMREFREHERIDIGDDVKNININSSTRHTITGDVHVAHHGVNETAFTDYVRKALDTKVINVNAIEVSANDGEGQLLLKAAEHLLVDTDLLDQINTEDMAAEEASKK